MKRILTLTLTILLLALLLCCVCFAEEPYVVDSEGLLSADELAQLSALAAQVSDRYACSVAILTTDSFEGKNIDTFTEDYYDHNQLGYADTEDGVFLVVSSTQGEYCVTAAGIGELVIYGNRYNELEDAFFGYLRNHDFYGAFSAYIRTCDYLLAHKDDPIDDGTYGEPEVSTPARTATGGILAAITGFLGSLIPTGIMKSKNNNVAKKQTASNYVRSGSLQLYMQEDRFVRTETNRVRIESDRVSGGGGGSHFSSSGVSHTTHSGKF